MFSYYAVAPAEISVLLPWAAAYPYWQAGRQAGIPPASYPLSHQARQPLLFETWMDSLETILLETTTSLAGLEGSLQQSLSQQGCFPGKTAAAPNGCCSSGQVWHYLLLPCPLHFVLLIGRHSRSMVTCFLLLLPGIPAFTILG